MKYFFFLSSLSIIISCSERKEISERFDNGQVQEECDEINPKNGECVGYYKSGEVKYQVVLKDGELNGEAKFYHKNGKEHWKGQYTNGFRNGKILYYDSLGKPYQQSNFKNSKLDGLQLKYAGSIVSKESRYDNGRLIWLKEFDAKGNLVDYMKGYKLEKRIKNDSIEFKISLNSPEYDVIHVEIFADSVTDNTPTIIEEFAVLNDTVSIKRPIDISGKAHLDVQLYELDTFDTGQGVIKTKTHILFDTLITD